MAFPTRRLETLTRRFLPPRLARTAKRIAVPARYRSQVRACREGYRMYGDRYPNPVLFIAGLPKSGTTWVEKMIASYPGYHDLLIPDVVSHELATGGSHDYELPADMFERFSDMLVLTKMHVRGSPHNAAVLRKAGVPYAVVFRDLRDVAVSNYFYVRRTPWHAEHPAYAEGSLEAGLALFAERTLPAYAAWVRSWHENIDPDRGVILQYERLLADTEGEMTRLTGHFGLPHDPETIASIVERNRLDRLRQAAGEASGQSFFRKGVAGDWANHFTPALKDLYKKVIGDFLVEFGYEQDLSW